MKHIKRRGWRKGWMSIDEFKRMRNELGLSQARLAEFIGCASSTIEKIEAGKVDAGIPNVYAMLLCTLKERMQLAEFIEEKFSPLQVRKIVGRGAAATAGKGSRE